MFSGCRCAPSGLLAAPDFALARSGLRLLAAEALPGISLPLDPGYACSYEICARAPLGGLPMRCTRILLCGAALIAGHFSTAASAQPGAVFGDVTFGEVL